MRQMRRQYNKENSILVTVVDKIYSNVGAVAI
jgi:hypothetical protein